MKEIFAIKQLLDKVNGDITLVSEIAEDIGMIPSLQKKYDELLKEKSDAELHNMSEDDLYYLILKGVKNF